MDKRQELTATVESQKRVIRSLEQSKLVAHNLGNKSYLIEKLLRKYEQSNLDNAGQTLLADVRGLYEALTESQLT